MSTEGQKHMYPVFITQHSLNTLTLRHTALGVREADYVIKCITYSATFPQTFPIFPYIFFFVPAAVAAAVTVHTLPQTYFAFP